MSIILQVLIGIVVGFISGLSGMGGGAIFVPVLFFLFSLSIKEAIGTSLFIIVFSSLSAFLSHWKGEHVNFRIAFFTIIFGIAGASAGARLNAILPETIVKIILVFIIISLGLKMWTMPALEFDNCVLLNGINRKKAVLISIIGLLGGIISGFGGVGGAVFIIPMLHLFVKIPLGICVGTVLLAVFFNALSGTLTYCAAHLVNYKLGLMIAIGAIPAAPFGAKLCRKVSGEKLNKIIAGILMAAGIAILFQKR